MQSKATHFGDRQCGKGNTVCSGPLVDLDGPDGRGGKYILHVRQPGTGQILSALKTNMSPQVTHTPEGGPQSRRGLSVTSYTLKLFNTLSLAYRVKDRLVKTD